MSPESRAAYFRDRREKYKQLVFMVERPKAEALDAKLAERGEKRAEWFRRIVDRELSEK